VHVAVDALQSADEAQGLVVVFSQPLRVELQR
jgi:hypothetical protein